jgi:hypothetical protein
MSIEIVIGNVGSGKSLFCVRNIVNDHSGIHTFTNIKFIKKLPHVHLLKTENFVKVEVIGQKKNGEDITKAVFNKEFWLDIKKKYGRINIVLDEAHIYMDSRNFASRLNKNIMSNFIALIRKILGGSDASMGRLILITQLFGRIDNRAREMATNVICIEMMYQQNCKHCGLTWNETNLSPEPALSCPRCNYNKLTRNNHQMVITKYQSAQAYELSKMGFPNTHYGKQVINDGHLYFKYYDTNQIEGLIEDIEHIVRSTDK